MRNDSVPYRDMHVAHDAKCFSPCVYLHLRRLFDNFIFSQKCDLMGRMSKQKRDWAQGLIKNMASLRLIRKLL